ncbi:M23 family metallopeptidase [Mechercharimyces sp. CAU 1602]|uniref:M23 family metallopeptidase n=1 Tax=Mechercharimyces sp. CAU 1602 TaxID=2973933 RepID=UPI0021623B2E|nr:M23 family metallopeptidase [Mechercharimyces sp. CAU 1602]MCS1351432.1 M23 family metallopeptidase [Mechercharimyces sp. CAU 1602]
MSEFKESIRKRREQRIQQIQQGRHHRFIEDKPDRGWESTGKRNEIAPWNQGVRPPNHGRSKVYKRFFIQVVLSSMLFLLTYMIFTTSTTASMQAQMAIEKTMERPFDFTGVARWYHENLEGNSALIPAFSGGDQKEQPQGLAWGKPLNGEIEVVRPFASDEPMLVLRAQSIESVIAVERGWVIFAGEKEGLGKTVILRHLDGQETWYAHLEEIVVEERDWIQKEEKVGVIGEKEGDSLLYFGYRKEDQFQNPSGVIPFEQ